MEVDEYCMAYLNYYLKQRSQIYLVRQFTDTDIQEAIQELIEHILVMASTTGDHDWVTFFQQMTNQNKIKRFVKEAKQYHMYGVFVQTMTGPELLDSFDSLTQAQKWCQTCQQQFGFGKTYFVNILSVTYQHWLLLQEIGIE